MKKNDILPITVTTVTNRFELPSVGDDFVLLDSLRRLPDLALARRMSLCVFAGVCTSGIIALTVNEKRRIVSSETVLLITDESVVNDIRFSDDFDGFGFFISYKLLQDVLRDVNNMSDLFLLTHNHPVFELKYDEVKCARAFFDGLKERIEGPYNRYIKEIVRLQILTLLYDFTNTFERVLNTPGKEEKQSRAERIFVQFVQLVEHHYCEERQVQWYAQRLNLTPKYLSEVISNVSRRTPNDWIDKFVTTEMRNLLKHTDMKMSEIAKEMNFPSQSFFGKYFKENVGVSPTEYRKGCEL